MAESSYEVDDTNDVASADIVLEVAISCDIERIACPALTKVVQYRGSRRHNLAHGAWI